MYYYRLYGLCAASSFELPDAAGAALPADAAPIPDITLTTGDVPDFRNETGTVRLSDDWYYAAPKPALFYMCCNGFAFAVADGRTVTVGTRAPDTEHALLTYLLGSAFGVVGMQRGLVPIHGAAVATENTVAIITGYSGSGKSAILSALVRDGYRYLADDVCMVGIEDGKPVVFPSYPQRKLAAATAAETGEDVGGALFFLEDGREKYAIRKTAEWLDQKLPLSRIVELVPAVRNDGAAFTPEIQKVTGHASLGIVLKNRYRSQFADSIDASPQRMKRLLQITASIGTYKVIRPKEGFPVRDTARLIANRCF